MSEDFTEVRMEIRGLILDPASSVPIVILREQGGETLLPIWIGTFEANAIATQIENVEPPRPLTHDLLAGTLQQLGATVEKVVICDLRDSTFFALIHVRHGDEVHPLDARPSDAIALALRAGAPIFVLRDVLDRARAADRAMENDPRDDEKLRRWLEEIGPEELGKYTM